MNREEFFKFHQECTQKMTEIVKAKNHDYSHNDDTFTNFESVGSEWAEIGFYTRMMDKMSRIKSFIKKGTLKVADGSVQDTLLDLANYSILLAGYIKHKSDDLSGI